MRAITFQSVTAYLLDDIDLDGSDIQIEAAVPVSVETGLTGRESRLPTGDTLRLALTYTAVLQGAAVPQLRNCLQAISTERVLCPLIPAMFAAGDTPAMTAAYYVLMGDGDAPEIKLHADLPFNRPAFPLMVGRLKDTPDPTLLSGLVESVSFHFIETDTWFLTPPAYTPPDALMAAGGVRPLFPFRPNWATPPHSGAANRLIERRSIGRGRQEASAYYTQPSRRPVQQSFTLIGAEIWQLLRLVLDWQATRQNFWLPGALTEAALTADVTAAATALPVDDPGARGDNLAVVLDDDTTRVPALITGTSGSTWTLAAPIGTPLHALYTRIETLFLARLGAASVKLSCPDMDVAQATVDFVEVPWEAATVTGETIGTTQGPLTTQAYLYTFRIAYPGATQIYRFTSFERDLTNSGATWTAISIDHGDVKESGMLERQEVTVTSRHFSSNPMSLLVPFRLEWPLQVDIFECDVAAGAATNLRQMFSGEIETAEPDGPFISAKAKSLSSLFDRKLPRARVQPECNLTLFESLCTLDPEAWKWQGTVVAYNSATYELLVNTISRVTGSGVTLDAHFFSNGYVRLGSGSAVQFRWIADSTAPTSGELALLLAFGFATAPTVGATVYFYPGCDGRYATCINKFGNRANFLGFPFMPVGNPSAMKVSKNVTSAGKK